MNKYKKQVQLFAFCLALGLAGGSFYQSIVNKEEVENLIDNQKNDDFHKIDTIRQSSKSKETQENESKEIEKFEEPEESKEIETIQITDNDELTEYLGYNNVSFDEIQTVIRNNAKISEKYKNKILKVINKLEEKTPYIDLRCLYENIKLLDIEEISREEMTKRVGENVAGYFSSSEHKIVILKNGNNHAFYHEVIHMIIHLELNLGDYKIVKSFNSNEMGDSFDEGFTEWLTLFLFEFEDMAYQQQVNNMDVIKYLLNENDEEFITDFTNYDYNNIFDKMANFLDLDQVETLFLLCDKEKRSLIDNNEEKTLIEDYEIEDKYDILMQALITSRAGVVNKEEILKIYNLLYKSYKYYLNGVYNSKSDNNIVDDLQKKYFETLLQYAENPSNDIVIYNLEEKINYYDINSLYLGVRKAEDGWSYIIVEKYIDADSNQKYYFSNYSLLNGDFSQFKCVPITSLISNMDVKNSVTGEELFNQYYNNYVNNKSKVYSYTR